MRQFVKYIGPAIYGLVVYFTIRLINDTVSGFKFWERWWGTIAIEIATSILLGYISVYLIHFFERKILQKSLTHLHWKSILGDFLKVYLYCFIILNTLVTPMAALTDDGLSIFDFVQINIIPTFYLLLYFAIIRGNVYLKAHVANKLKLEQVKSEQLKTELAYLKAQIHPHFLFNAINTVYFEMDENVDDAKLTLEKFSELLRYQLYSKENELVSLAKEFDHLQNFITLQQKRFTSKLKLNVELPKQLNQSYKVQPFLMLPLVENAFKYVGGDYWLKIHGVVKDGNLLFEISNAKSKEKHIDTPNSGIGLKNLRRRLDLLYENEYRLDVDDELEYFSVQLSVKLES